MQLPSIAIAYGDGIGPEIMEAALLVMREAGANIAVETVSMGERMYAQGSDTGILPSAWETLRRTKVLLKAPTISPSSPGHLSVTEALKERFGLWGKINTIPLAISGAVSASPSAGMEAAAWLGADFAIFEPVHGPVDKLAGKGTANPSGMLRAAVMMLYHLGQTEPAARIHRAWLAALQNGMHTADISITYRQQPLGTHAFANAVIERLWRKHPE